ncbi:MAG: hypothetical protein OHK0053_34690 [Microscillaceae bacterium]
MHAQGIMNFVEETHDFGTIKEGEIATYEFTFTNTGNQPIEIAGVKASCGCTTPSWSQGLIQPGQKGFIKASYNSKGRPGAFTKSITVRSNAKKDVQILYIKGFVDPANTSTSQSQGQQYTPTTFTQPGASRRPATFKIDNESHDFGQVKTGQVVRQRFNIYNAGQENLIITGFDRNCDCISFGLSSATIAPNQTSILEITLTGKKIMNLDESFVIYTNDPQNQVRTIHLQAEIIEDFSQHLFRPLAESAPFGQ